MIVLRHCQSEFNLHFTRTRQDPGIVDPVLTELGQRQAEQVAASLDAVEITRILVSPYTRALQTAMPVAARRGLVPQVSDAVRERRAFVCDVGTRRSQLATAWPALDFAALDEVWWPDRDEPTEDVIERARRFRTAMAARANWRTTLVISHWGFLLALCGSSIENGTFRVVDPTREPEGPLAWRH